jgi:hypothetical protein
MCSQTPDGCNRRIFTLPAQEKMIKHRFTRDQSSLPRTASPTTGTGSDNSRLSSITPGNPAVDQFIARAMCDSCDQVLRD